jgi:hypothetical protein
MSCPLALYGYVTSACWQIENVKIASTYAVRSLETGKPPPNQTPGKRPGRNSCSESVGSMSPSVHYVRKEECGRWRRCFLFDATALRGREKSYEPCTNKRPSFLRKWHPFSPRPPMAQNHEPAPFSSLHRPGGKDIGARNEPVSLQNAQNGS